MRLEPGAVLPNAPPVNVLGPDGRRPAAHCASRLAKPFTMDWTSDRNPC